MLARRTHRKMATIDGQRYIPAMETSDISIGRATLLIVVSALSFGSISVLTVLVTKAGVPLLTAMAWRYVLGAVLLLAITGVSLFALEYIPVGPLAFLFYTYPAWVALIAAMRRTEKLTAVRAIALTLALVGVTVMVGAPSADKLNPIGVILALGSALLYFV